MPHIEQIKKKKEMLEADIFELIDEFEKYSGMEVTEVWLDRIDCQTYTDKKATKLTDVKIAVKL